MSHTKDKLSEAEYFLDRMIEHRENEHTFGFNLSAFLAAFQSVTWVMQKEFHRSRGFLHWYETQRSRMKADSRMRLLAEKRVVTIHKEPVRPTKNTKVAITLSMPSWPVSLVVTDPDGTVRQRYASAPQKSSEDTMRITHRWLFQEIPETDVVTICRECAEVLSAMVSECEDRFSPAG